MREIRTLRARRRELETEPRTGLNGHAGGNPGYSQASVLTGHRASSRPYNYSLLTRNGWYQGAYVGLLIDP